MRTQTKRSQNKSKTTAGGLPFLPLFLFMLFLILLAVCVSVLIGAVEISPDNVVKILVNRITGRALFPTAWETKVENIIWSIRLPRVLLAFLVGAGLALCGVLMQALTKNSLADPYVLGISAGASAGAVCVMVLGWFGFLGGYAVMFGAALGAMLSIGLSLRIASVGGHITATRLVLAGIATSALFQALTNLLVYGYHTGSDKTKTALYWMVGSLSGASWGKVKYAAVVFAVTVIAILLFSRHLDLLLLGDSVAETLGMETRTIKLVMILASTVLAGTVVSVSGVIGFVGLVVPHIVRSLTGSVHRQLIPLVILCGGLFTVLADMLSRIIIAPEELPIGVVSAFFGAPFFLYLIHKSAGDQR